MSGCRWDSGRFKGKPSRFKGRFSVYGQSQINEENNGP